MVTWDIDSAWNNSDKITMTPHGLAPARIPVRVNQGEINVAVKKMQTKITIKNLPAVM